MPKFPLEPLSTINYVPRDSYFQANKREFRIMKKQDNNNDDYATPATPLPTKSASTKLTADTVIPELEREIGQAESFMIEIDEIIGEWNSQHTHQYKPIERGVVFNEVFVPTPFALTPSKELRKLISAHKTLEKRVAQRAATAGGGGYDAQRYGEDTQKLVELTQQINEAQALLQQQHDEEEAEKEADIDLRQQESQANQANFDATPENERFDSRTKTSNNHFLNLPPLAQRLLTTTGKTLTIINNIKIIYKSKISGNKLNRFDQTDMIKIQGLMDKFLGICKDIAEKMKSQPKAVLDSILLLTPYSHIRLQRGQNYREQFHHAYDKAEQKFIKLINEIDTLYIADKQRYSFNLGKY